MHRLTGLLGRLDTDRDVEGDPGGEAAARLDAAKRQAEELAALLRRASGEHPTTARTAELVHALLVGPAEAVADAVAEIGQAGLLPPGSSVVVAAVGTRGSVGAPLGPAVSRARTQLCDASLQLGRPDHEIVVCVAPAGLARAYVALESARRRIEADTGDQAQVVVGVGGRRAGLPDAGGSYDEARLALRVARLTGRRPIRCWADLGVYRVASRLADRGERVETVHPGLAQLTAKPDAAALLQTLETYLDTAGNAHATAEALCVHRTSLYYRLQRIEHLVGTDLKDGSERAVLHVALKLGRLTGEYGAGRHANVLTAAG
jgi:hypothetical protein